MNEKALPVLDKYDIDVKSTKRVRGAYYCYTDKGLLLLKEYDNSNKKLEILYKLHGYLEENGIKTDKVLQNADGQFISAGPDGGNYILKKWYEHRECDPENTEDILTGVNVIAKIHVLMENMGDVFDNEENIPVCKGCYQNIVRHNKEISRVYKYIDKLKSKTEFEFLLREQIRYFKQQAETAENMSNQRNIMDYEMNCVKRKVMCHGNARCHNIIIANNEAALTNYVGISLGVQVNDLYTYLKKIMEKNEWDIELASQILRQYENVRELPDIEKSMLKLLFMYPEKFWKVVNVYFNSNKSWPSEKNKEKLDKIIKDEPYRVKFIETLTTDGLFN